MKKILVFIVAFISFKSAVSQIGLGITTPHPNAYFQINSTNKGVLLPRMAAIQRLAIAPSATANGLLVFDTDSSAYMYWTGSDWKKMGGEDGSNWSLHGNLNTNPPASANNIGINFVTDTYFGTPDAKDVSFVAGGNELLRLNQFATGGRVGLSNRKPEYSLDIRTTEINNETQIQGMRLIAKPLFDLMSASNIDKGLVFGYNPVNENEMAVWNHANNLNGSIRFGLDVFNNSISPAFNITGTGQGINQRNPLYFLDIHSESQFALANNNVLNKNGIRISYPNQGMANNMERGLFMGLGTDGNYKSYIWNYADGTGGNTTSKTILFGIGGDLVNNTRPTIQMQDGILSIGHIRNTSSYPSVINIQTDFAHSVSKKGLSILDNNTANDELAYMGLDVSGNLELTKFVSGDITFNTGNQNRLIIKSDGKVGIGTASPLARLHVADSAVLFSGREDINFGAPDPPPITGIGSRMMWYPQKAAFRAGRLDINCPECWSKDSIGFHSIAGGANPKAIGISSIAFGANVTAREAGSIALGIGSQADGFATFSAGNYSKALQYGSVAIGDQALSSGAGAISLGNLTEAIGEASFATGLRTKALGLYSFAAGNLSEARADYAIALGRSFANGEYSFAYGNQSAANGTGSFAGGVNAISFGENSFAFGKEVTAYANNAFCFGDNVGTKFDGSFVTGTYNELQVGLPERIFEVANGTSSLRQNAFTILKTGAVGIGTVNPQYRLDVAGNIHAQTDVQVDGRTETDLLGANNGTIINLTVPDRITAFKTSVNDTLDTRYFKLYDGFGNAGYVLTSDAEGNGSWQPSAISNWSSDGTHIYNNNIGNVGIGVSDPAFRLDVGSRMRIRSGGDKFSTAGIWLNNIANDASPAFVGMESDDAVGFYSSTSGWDFVMKIGTGYVGIGTTNPSEKLHVNGNILATGIITPSDIRYKKNITSIQNPLLKLAALNGVTYFMNRAAHPEWQFDSTLQYGLIAQEVEKVFPEIVKTISADGYKGLDYVKLVPVLLEGIKELDKKNIQLTEDNKLVRQRLTWLEEKVNALLNVKTVK